MLRVPHILMAALAVGLQLGIGVHAVPNDDTLAAAPVDAAPEQVQEQMLDFDREATNCESCMICHEEDANFLKRPMMEGVE